MIILIKVHVPIKAKEYDILIKKGILSDINQYIDTSRQIVIISDDNIPKKYINILLSKLDNPLSLFIPEGEQSKSMEMASILINQLLENKITRSATIIALGGGVVGDLVGFVSSIYLRGVDYIQIPTTLLSQIDSSVGGKVGVNTKTMKNAIGAFKQPKLVLIDPDTLSTLDQRQISSGISEMIKYALIASKPLFKELEENNILDNIEHYIATCVSIKKDLVVQDEYDYGLRQLLNYGHTIGHAIEQYSNYELLHGEAIAIGMVQMAKQKAFYQDLVTVLHKYNLPTQYEYDKETIFQLIQTDKKASNQRLNIILVDEVGKGYIKPINISDIKERI